MHKNVCIVPFITNQKGEFVPVYVNVKAVVDKTAAYR